MSKQQSINSIAEVIKKRRRALYIKTGYISLLLRIILLAAVGFVILTQLFLITQAKGNDMFPAIKDGDLVIAFRLQKEFAKNDIVVYQVGDKTYLGRIVANGDDNVKMDDTGTLEVNGAVQRGEIVYPTLAKAGIDYPVHVPDDAIFLLGDHRMETHDSRDFGAIPMNKVNGKVITILRRRGL